MDASLLNVLAFVLVGFILGWGLEFAFDFLYWRRRTPRIVTHPGAPAEQSLPAIVDAADEEMLRRALGERDEALLQARRQITMRSDEIARTELAIRDYELSVTHLRNQLDEHQAELQHLRASTPADELATRDAEISTLRAQLNSSQSAVENLQRQIALHTAQVQAFEDQLAGSPRPLEIESLRAQLDERVAELSRLQSEVASREREAMEVEGYLQDRDDEVKRLRRELGEATSELDALRQREMDRLVIEETEYIHDDDLTDIKGVGDVYEERLREAGYHTFRHLADAGEDELKTALNIPAWRTPNLLSWIDQAAKLVEQKELEDE